MTIRDLKAAILPLMLVAIACDQLASTYEPSSQNIRDRLGDFIVTGATDLRPVYANSDVDSVVATYCVREPMEVLRADLAQRAAQQRWHTVESDTGHGIFERTDRERYERVDVLWSSVSRCVGLSYLQTDAPDARAFERSSEAEWARDELWPVLQRAMTEVENATR